MDPRASDIPPEEDQADDLNSVKADPPDWIGLRTLLKAGSRSTATTVCYVIAALILGIIGLLCFMSFLMEH